MLNDDKQHAIELLLDGKNLTMRVDGGLARSLINLGSKVFFLNLYLIGFETSAFALARSLIKLGSKVFFSIFTQLDLNLLFYRKC